jgi:hypothetical protein
MTSTDPLLLHMPISRRKETLRSGRPTDVPRASHRNRSTRVRKHSQPTDTECGHTSYRWAVVPFVGLPWGFAPIEEVFRFEARRWRGRQEHRTKPALLSISRHRPSAQGAPLQSLILSVDRYDCTGPVNEINHSYLQILHPVVDTPQQARGCSSGCERSQSESVPADSSVARDRIDPGTDPQL